MKLWMMDNKESVGLVRKGLAVVFQLKKKFFFYKVTQM